MAQQHRFHGLTVRKAVRISVEVVELGYLRSSFPGLGIPDLERTLNVHATTLLQGYERRLKTWASPP